MAYDPKRTELFEELPDPLGNEKDTPKTIVYDMEIDPHELVSLGMHIETYSLPEEHWTRRNQTSVDSEAQRINIAYGIPIEPGLRRNSTAHKMARQIINGVQGLSGRARVNPRKIQSSSEAISEAQQAFHGTPSIWASRGEEI